MAGVATASPENTPIPIATLDTVINSSVVSLESYINSQPNNAKNATMKKDKDDLKDIEDFCNNTENTISQQCIKFFTLFDSNKSRTIYMIKSLLEICILLADRCEQEKAEFLEAFGHDINKLSDAESNTLLDITNRLTRLQVLNTELNYSIFKYFSKYKCTPNEEKEYNKIKNISNNSKIPWYKRIEPRSPTWLKIDIHGKITIYSYNLKKWICAHPIYHKFAFDFVVRHNIPFNTNFIVWSGDNSKFVNKTLAAPISKRKEQLQVLLEYFNKFEINNSNRKIVSDKTKEFRNHVDEFKLLLDDNAKENQVKLFLSDLNNNKIYMQINSIMRHTFHDSNTNNPISPPEYTVSDIITMNEGEEKFNASLKIKIYNRIRDILKSIQPGTTNPYLKDIDQRGNRKANLQKLLKVKNRTTESGEEKSEPSTQQLQSTSVAPGAYSSGTVVNLLSKNRVTLGNSSNASRQSATAATAEKEQAGQAAAANGGGARKYPAKKYRFASRKHSKRCKTTSHKKACRRKSHKHRRITRKQ